MQPRRGATREHGQRRPGRRWNGDPGHRRVATADRRGTVLAAIAPLVAHTSAIGPGEHVLDLADIYAEPRTLPLRFGAAQEAEAEVVQQIREIHDASDSSDGSPRVTSDAAARRPAEQ